MFDDAPDEKPYRPPPPSSGEPTTRVCPDCLRDPDHGTPDGRRPIEEFRLITGKAAARYANKTRRFAYCHYHEKKRIRARLAQRMQDDPLGMRRTLAAARRRYGERLKANPTSRVARSRALAMKQKLKHLKFLRDTDPAYAERIREQGRQSRARMTEERKAEIKAYKAQWFQDMVDREIAAGRRPPRGMTRKQWKLMKKNAATAPPPPPPESENESGS